MYKSNKFDYEKLFDFYPILMHNFMVIISSFIFTRYYIRVGAFDNDTLFLLRHNKLIYLDLIN